MSDEAVQLLKEILFELRRQGPKQPELITLEAFCKRLGRSTDWGYNQIKVGRIVPAKTGKKPYMVNPEQIKNFL